jgi:hypothetical protein
MSVCSRYLDQLHGYSQLQQHRQTNMCRFLVNPFLPVHAPRTDFSQVYKGSDEILLSKLILDPTHSILTQSFDSRLRLDMRRPHNGQ